MRVLSLIIIIIFSFTQMSLGQHYTPEEIQLEKMLIESSREKFLQNYEKAIAILEQAIKLDENNAAVTFELGKLYTKRGDNENSVKMLKKAVDLEGDNQWYVKELLEVYRHTGRYEDALTLCQKLVDDNPYNKNYYYDLAWYNTVLNKFSKAIKVYDKMENKFGYNDQIATRKHRLYLVSGDKKKAEKEYIRLTSKNPENIDHKFLLSQFYENQGDKSNANKIYQEILTLDPENPEATMAMAGSKSKNKGDLAYLNALMPVFEKEDLNIDLKIEKLIPLITKVSATGDQELADGGLQLTSILEKIHPQDAKSFAASGDLLYHSNRSEAALEKYKSSLSLSESNFLIWENVMYIYFELGDYEKLLSTSENAIDIFPNKAVTYYLNGEASHKLGNNNDALGSLNQALLMSSKNVVLKFKIYKLQGMIYCEMGKPDKAEKAFKKGGEINPGKKDKLNCNDHK
jgi:tetratricopeptide (TPR) repeat protein